MNDAAAVEAAAVEAAAVEAAAVEAAAVEAAAIEAAVEDAKPAAVVTHTGQQLEADGHVHRPVPMEIMTSSHSVLSGYVDSTATISSAPIQRTGTFDTLFSVPLQQPPEEVDAAPIDIDDVNNKLVAVDPAGVIAANAGAPTAETMSANSIRLPHPKKKKAADGQQQVVVPVPASAYDRVAGLARDVLANCLPSDPPPMTTTTLTTTNPATRKSQRRSTKGTKDN